MLEHECSFDITICKSILLYAYRHYKRACLSDNEEQLKICQKQKKKKKGKGRKREKEKEKKREVIMKKKTIEENE
jgi:hypothetical protein